MNKTSIAIICVLLQGCSNSEQKTIAVPVESCTAEYTGKTRTDEYTTYICYSYGKNGECTLNIPTTQYVESKEAAYVCKFNLWQ
jgi:hypothetical protein